MPLRDMHDKVKQSQRITAIQFANGMTVVAPTDQWIALLFDVLHPSQQEAIVERIQSMADAQAEDKSLIEIPGFFDKPGEHLTR